MAEGAKRAAGLKTRAAVLEAARHLFLRQGYHATGMREIAHETGISLGAVYNHFSSKEDIFQALLSERSIYRAIGAALRRAQGDNVAELLQSGFTQTMGMLEGRVDFPLLLFIDILEFQGRHAARLMAEVLPDLIDFFQRLYQLGQERGEMRPVPPMLLARAYLGMIFSSFIIEHVIGTVVPAATMLPLHVEKWEQGMVDILLHGVLKETPTQDGE